MSLLKLKDLKSVMMSDWEAVVYLLVVSGLSTRDLGQRLGVSHQSIVNAHSRASKKLESSSSKQPGK